MIMGFDPENEADFLKHPLFVKLVSSPNPEVKRFWDRWCADHPEKTPMFHQAMSTLKSLQWKETYLMESKDRERLLNRVLSFNQEWENKRERNSGITRKSFFFILWAASLALTGYMIISYMEVKPVRHVPSDHPQWIVKSTPKGLKKIFRMPDGSSVILNSDSEIRYTSNFRNERSVVLRGQAFFQVQEDPDRPFRVSSGQLETTVLGTSFDVKAYPGQEDIHVAVVSGTVAVATQQGVTATVEANQATFYTPSSGSLLKKPFDYDQMIGWKEKKLKFHEEEYQKVFETLSRWYDVEFAFSPGTLLRGKYSGQFMDESLDNVLLGMKYSLGFEYNIQGKTVFIKYPSP